MPEPLPPRDPIFGPDFLADFQPQDPAAMVTKLNLNTLSASEGKALVDGVIAATQAAQTQGDWAGAATILLKFAGKAGFL